MVDEYLQVISRIERTHRQFLEIVKLELDGLHIREVNKVQALILFNILRAIAGRPPRCPCQVNREGARLARSGSAMRGRHIEMLKQTPVTQAELETLIVTLRRSFGCTAAI